MSNLSATKVKPVYDGAGEFAGFSVFLGGDWSAAQPYKVLMRAIADSGSEPIYPPARSIPRRRAFDIDRRVQR